MTKVMEQKIGPQADSRLHIKYQGEGAGSTALAQMIKSGLRTPDVFISASPSADKMLMGASNHNLVNWYLALAQDQLVIAYNPKSPFAKQLEAAAKGTVPWYQVMEEPGFRFGRTDPLLDPKGESTIYMFELAQSYYHQPNLFKQILGSNENPKQVFPEESLLSQLTTGQVDAIVAYKHEAVEWGVPYITLPDAINLGNVNDKAAYAKATMTENGKVKHGAPILFTITIPTTSKDPKDAAAFVQYLVSGQGHDILMKDGFTSVPTKLGGNKADVPSGLQNLIQGTMN
ncbi:molybdenum ABC transporter substrate-binding protein [Alicyclobacillus ferrooxydans]|uniref:Molybdenum ABC transporter substrate-binding protein n=2 Tax=Alicyclobacillus ferrooxydans TaxID=471514 RepID=A0A0P9CGZ1_9BACL|nr:molybdenum ABC transporter substrate-binding protein [Alicyclobacillus ferrooxydans]